MREKPKGQSRKDNPETQTQAALVARHRIKINKTKNIIQKNN